jgi:hypothetical protein
VHLSELLDIRARPLGGVLVTLTLRCPLSCAHCTTNSTNTRPQSDAAVFDGFFERLTPDSHPDVAFLTGGEPMLRPDLVERIADRMRAVGGRTVCLTGGFFAARPTIAATIWSALQACDLIMMSMDEFHAHEVDIDDVLGVLGSLRDAGKDVGLQFTGRGDDDPFLTRLVASVRERFDDTVPMFVSLLNPSGRGVDLFPPEAPTTRIVDAPPLPCRWANWPVIASDGTIIACCNSDLTQFPGRPGGLVLGHASQDSWHNIVRRAEESPFLLAITSAGPLLLAERTGGHADTDYCSTCRRIAADPAVETLSAEFLRTTLGRAVVLVTQGTSRPADFMPERFTELIELGRPR